MKKLNICIPMAGAGSRFKREGYENPKPFIDVLGKPMISWVIENMLIPNRSLHFIFVCQQEHVEKYNLKDKFDDIISRLRLNIDYDIVSINGLTEGSLCTILKARNYINNDNELLLANVDQYLDWSPQNFIELVEKSNCDGAIITSYSDSNKWSFCRINYNTGWITEVKEKEVISNIANTGIFYFKHGKDFVETADNSIHNNIRTNNEFFVSPTFNYLINTLGYKILNYPLSNHAFWGIGTPEDLKVFVEKFKEY